MRVDFPAFGRRLRERRLAFGLSQEKLAEIAGVSHQYIGQLERGERIPSVEMCVTLCYALNLSLNALFTDSLPEDMFQEEQGSALRQDFCLLHNTLSNWVLADLPDESLRMEIPADLPHLPPLDFMALDEDFLSSSHPFCS